MSIFNKVADLRPYKVIKEIPTQAFSCEYWKMVKNIYFEDHLCQRLLLPLEGFCKDLLTINYGNFNINYVNIYYGNASFGILEDSIWLQLIYFLTSIVFWLMKYLFQINGDNLSVLAIKDFTLYISCSNQPLSKIHGIP